MNILKHPDIFLRLKSDEIKLPLTPEDKGLINIMKNVFYITYYGLYRCIGLQYIAFQFL